MRGVLKRSRAQISINQMTIQEEIENLKPLAKQLTHQNLYNSLKKIYQEIKRSSPNDQQTKRKLFQFHAEIVILYRKRAEDQKFKVRLLELLERQMMSTKLNAKLFDALFEMVKSQYDNLVIILGKTIDALIKFSNDNTTMEEHKLDPKRHYLPLVEFLKNKSEIFCNLRENIEHGYFGKYRRIPSTHSFAGEQKSIKFTIYLPNLLMHVMAYLDLSRNNDLDTSQRLRDLLQKSIGYIINSLKRISIKETHEKMNIEFTQDVLGILVKNMQFIYIILKNQRDSHRESNSRILRNNISEQMKHFKVIDILMNFIHLLHECPVQYNYQRFQFVNRLKSLIIILNPQKITKQEASILLKEIMNQETRYGKDSISKENCYLKNVIENHWSDILKCQLVIFYLFPPNVYTISKQAPDFDQQFSRVQRILDGCIRNLFDPNVYHHIQDKSIEIMQQFIQNLFKNPDNINEASNTIAANQNLKANHQKKLALLTKLLDVIANKFASIRQIFQQINVRINIDPVKANLNPPNFLNPGKIAVRPLETADQWQEDPCIDSSLLSPITTGMKMVNVWQEDDDLTFNGFSIREDTYAQYIKQVKTKILDKLVLLTKRIIQFIYTWTLRQIPQSIQNSLRQLYHYSANNTNAKRTLSDQQCQIVSRIFHEGLKIFEFLHQKGFHNQGQSKKGYFKNFMCIFADIYDPINFRDIFLPHRALFFDHLLLYTKECPQNCLQTMLTQPFCPTPPTSQLHRNVVNIMIHTLFIYFRHQNLHELHPYYGRQDQYFNLLQKLIRLPIRCISKYKDDSIIRNHLKQFVLLLIKKIHFSGYCLDHLFLLRTLFKNIIWPFGQGSLDSYLYNDFYQLCQKDVSKNSKPSVNVIQNLYMLFNTGITQLTDAVSQLVIMVPVKSKNIMALARTGHFVRPLLNCLFLGQTNYSLRAIKTFEIMFNHSSYYQIQHILAGHKESLISKLLDIARSARLSESKLQNLSISDIACYSLKLLAKLGALHRLYSDEHSLLPKDKTPDLILMSKSIDPEMPLDINVTQAVNYCIDVFKKVLDVQFQYSITAQTFQAAFSLMMKVAYWALKQPSIHPIVQKILSCFLFLTVVYSKNSNTIISVYLSQQIELQQKDFFQTAFWESIRRLRNGQPSFRNMMIDSFSAKLLNKAMVSREEQVKNNQSKITVEQYLIKFLQNDSSSEDYIIGSILRSLQNINRSQFLNLRTGVMSFLMEKFMYFKNGITAHLHNILVQVYNGLLIQDILLVRYEYCSFQILKLILKHLKQTQQLVGPKSNLFFTHTVENLISYQDHSSTNALKIMRLWEIQINSVLPLLFGIRCELNEPTAFKSPDLKTAIEFSQKFSINQVIQRHGNTHIGFLLNRIKDILGYDKEGLDYLDQELRSNDRKLINFSNCFRTLQFLLSVREGQQFRQSFRLINQMEQEQSIQDTLLEIIEKGKRLVSINEKLYGSNLKLIFEIPNQTNSARTAQTADRTQNKSNGYVINLNTYFDDRDFDLSIDDIDFSVRNWGKLISSIIIFTKEILISPSYIKVYKENKLNKKEKSKILAFRNRSIEDLFELLKRVDRNVRQAAFSSLLQLLNKQQNNKELLPNSQLRVAMRPVVICIQLQFRKFSPQFICMFQKTYNLIASYFKQNFLCGKLMDRLQQVQKLRTSQQNNQISYTEIYNQCKTLNKLIFQLTKSSLYMSVKESDQHKKKFQQNIQQIRRPYKYVTSFYQFYASRLSKPVANDMIYRPLAAYISCIINYCDQRTFSWHQSKFLSFILQVINFPQSLPIRQWLTRPGMIESLLEQRHQKQQLKKLSLIKILCQLSPNFPKDNFSFFTRIHKLFEQRLKEIENAKSYDRPILHTGEFKIILQILVMILKINKHSIDKPPRGFIDISIIFQIVKILRIRLPENINFLRTFIRYQLSQILPPQKRRIIIKEIFQKFNDIKESKTPAEQKILFSEQLLYPILIRAHKKQQLYNCIFDASILAALKNLVLKNLDKDNLKTTKHMQVSTEVLQLLSLLMSLLPAECLDSMKDQIFERSLKLIKMQDKLFKHYSYIVICNCIKYLGFKHDIDRKQCILGIYLNLFKQLDQLSNLQLEVGGLNKKALSILIPLMSDICGGQNRWYESSRFFNQQSQENTKMVRYWQIFVKNHDIFKRYKDYKFQTSMINSMQWLVITSNPTSTIPIVKKVSSDMSFIYIQWKYQQLQTTIAALKNNPFELQQFLHNWNQRQSSSSGKAAEICLNFFIKLAFYNCMSKDDRDIMKRSLYLLRKTLMLWPNSVKRYQQIKIVISNMKMMWNSSNQNPNRFYLVLLNIILIMIQFETQFTLRSSLHSIFDLLKNSSPPSVSTASSVFTQQNPSILNYINTIFKKLMQAAKHLSLTDKFFLDLTAIVREGLDQYVKYNANQVQSNRTSRGQNSPMIKIQVCIILLKHLFDFNDQLIDSMYNNIKQAAVLYKSNEIQKSQPKRVQTKPQNLINCAFSSLKQPVLQDHFETSINPIQQNQENGQILSYDKKYLYAILLRILGSKFNQYSPLQQQQILQKNFKQKSSDFQLRIQILNILRAMYVGPPCFQDGIVPARYINIQLVSIAEGKQLYMLFDPFRLSQLLDRKKAKQNDMSSSVNQKINEEYFTKKYFDFLCQLLLSKDFHALYQLDYIKFFVVLSSRTLNSSLFNKILVQIFKIYKGTLAFSLELLLQDLKELTKSSTIPLSLQSEDFMLFLCRVMIFVIGIKGQVIDMIQKLAINQTQGFYGNCGTLQTLFFSQANLIISSFNQLQKTQFLKTLLLYLQQAHQISSVWGSSILQLSLNLSKSLGFSLQPQLIYYLCRKIVRYGEAQSFLEKSFLGGNMWALGPLQALYKTVDNTDMVTGLRILCCKDEWLKQCLLNHQQRQYTRCLSLLNSPRLKQHKIESYFDLIQESFVNQCTQDVLKNLNVWQDCSENNMELQTRIQPFSTQFLKDKVTGYWENDFNGLYQKSLDNLVGGQQKFKDINNGLLYLSLFEWLSLPKYAKKQQNSILLKIQCISQLQQAYKLRDIVSDDNTSQGLNKFFNTLNSTLNQWRERSPAKCQSISAWNTLLFQRNFALKAIIQKTIQNHRSQIQPQLDYKQAYSLIDLNYNILQISKQHRRFGVLNFIKTLGVLPQLASLSVQQKFIAVKEGYNFYVSHRDLQSAKAIFDKIHNFDQKKLDQIAYFQNKKLLQADLAFKLGQIDSAFKQLAQSAKCSDKSYQCSARPWRDFLIFCYKSHSLTTDRSQQYMLLQQSLNIFPKAMTYKPNKTKALFSLLLNMAKQTKQKNLLLQKIQFIFSREHDYLYEYMLIWIKNILSFSKQTKKRLIPGLFKGLSLKYPQELYFISKGLNESAEQQIKKELSNYNPQIFSQLQKLKAIALGNQQINSGNLISDIYIPFLQQKIYIVAVYNKNSQIVLLGNDQKQYNFQLAKSPQNYLIQKQFKTIFNIALSNSRQSKNKGVQFSLVDKLMLNNQICLQKNQQKIQLRDIFKNQSSPSLSGKDLAVFNRAMKNQKNDEILKNYISSKTSSFQDYYYLRKKLARSLASASYVQFFMKNDSFIDNFSLSLKTGEFYLNSIRFNLNKEKDFKTDRPFSLRLSRNVFSFLTELSIYGTFLPCLVAAGNATLKPKLFMREYYNVLFHQLHPTQSIQDLKFKVIDNIERTNFASAEDLDIATIQVPKKTPFSLRALRLVEASIDVWNSDLVPLELQSWY